MAIENNYKLSRRCQLKYSLSHLAQENKTHPREADYVHMQATVESICGVKLSALLKTSSIFPFYLAVQEIPLSAVF
jgi:hypothetical protein